MQVAITGSNGQLGSELQGCVPAYVRLLPLTRKQIDFTDLTAESLDKSLPKNLDIIINCAAYTAVDKAESETGLAYSINALAVNVLAAYCQSRSIKLIHLSTDFVFDGANHTPYTVDTARNPQSTYGISKAVGEDFLFSGHPDATCIRTSWLYSATGSNFVKTMLKLMNTRESLNVVADQTGSPTWARDLANFIWASIEHDCSGYYHYSNEGTCSWFDFASAIYLLAKKKGLVRRHCTIQPITSAEYPTPAKRPAFSVLDKTLSKTTIPIVIPHWLSSLDAMLDDLD